MNFVKSRERFWGLLVIFAFFAFHLSASGIDPVKSMTERHLAGEEGLVEFPVYSSCLAFYSGPVLSVSGYMHLFKDDYAKKKQTACQEYIAKNDGNSFISRLKRLEGSFSGNHFKQSLFCEFQI